MSSPAELDRKIRQLDNDVQSIYELLSSIQATQRRHGNRLEEIAAAQAGQDTKLDVHDAKLDTQNAKLDTILRLLQPDDEPPTSPNTVEK
jgi:chromosome segregation ATPase